MIKYFRFDIHSCVLAIASVASTTPADASTQPRPVCEDLLDCKSDDKDSESNRQELVVPAAPMGKRFASPGIEEIRVEVLEILRRRVVMLGLKEQQLVSHGAVRHPRLWLLDCLGAGYW